MENSKEYDLIAPPHLNPIAAICLQQPLVLCLCFASNVLGSALDPNCKLDPCLKKKPLAQFANHLKVQMEDKAEAVQLTAYRTGAKRTRTLIFHDEVEERYYQPAKPGDVIQTIGCLLCQGTPIVAACISCAKRCCAECVEEVTGQCWACLDYNEKQVKRTTKQ